jgi:hypothetical protein
MQTQNQYHVYDEFIVNPEEMLERVNYQDNDSVKRSTEAPTLYPPDTLTYPNQSPRAPWPDFKHEMPNFSDASEIIIPKYHEMNNDICMDKLETAEADSLTVVTNHQSLLPDPDPDQ